jgi:hypothetical protein
LAEAKRSNDRQKVLDRFVALKLDFACADQSLVERRGHSNF